MDVQERIATELRALAADQPTQPADRTRLAIRRASRIRRARVTTAAAVLLAVGIPVGLVASNATTPRKTSYVGMQDWPDRSDPKDSARANGAIAQALQDNVAILANVRWLYRGRPANNNYAMPDARTTYVAVFLGEVPGSARPTLFVAWASTHDVDAAGNRLPGHSQSWTIQHVPLTAKTTTMGYFVPGGLNTLFVLGDPNRRRVSWQEKPLPFAPQHTLSSGSATSENGVFVIEAGRFLRGPVLVDGVDVSYGLSGPNLMRPGFVDGSSATASAVGLNSGGYGQSRPSNDGWTADVLTDLTPNPGAATLHLTCYGGGTITARLRDFSNAGPVLATSSIPCDGVLHAGFTHTFRHDRPFEFDLIPDRLQSYEYTL